MKNLDDLLQRACNLDTLEERDLPKFTAIEMLFVFQERNFILAQLCTAFVNDDVEHDLKPTVEQILTENRWATTHPECSICRSNHKSDDRHLHE